MRVEILPSFLFLTCKGNTIMAILSCNFKAFKFPKESGFEQFYNEHPEVKQTRALILNTEDGGHYALSIDAEFTNLVYGRFKDMDVKVIRLHQVCVDKVAFNDDPQIEYHGVHFNYEDNPDKIYFIAGPRYQVEATHKDLLSETLANNIQKVLQFTRSNNERIMNEVSAYVEGKQS